MEIMIDQDVVGNDIEMVEGFAPPPRNSSRAGKYDDLLVSLPADGKTPLKFSLKRLEGDGNYKSPHQHPIVPRARTIYGKGNYLVRTGNGRNGIPEGYACLWRTA